MWLIALKLKNKHIKIMIITHRAGLKLKIILSCGERGAQQWSGPSVERARPLEGALQDS